MSKDAIEKLLAAFPLKKNCNNDVKVIIGERAYTQSLNGVPLSVDGSQSSVDIYRRTGHIAFLVSDWIKAHEPLEMMFNLLFGVKNAIPALALLKELNISPQELADFLWQKANLVLVDRKIAGTDQKDAISAFIASLQRQHRRVQVLFVGDGSQKAFPSLPPSCESACAIYPSGNNLNVRSALRRYTDNWYTLKGEELINRTPRFSLDRFMVFG